MSVPESPTILSLEDVLTALEVRLELEAVIDRPQLTQVLEQCLLFAQTHDLTDIAQLIKQELDGYVDKLPSDRNVKLSYFDGGGQLVNGLNQYSNYPLVTGIRKLELHLKNGLTLRLPAQILTFLSEVAGREVDNGHVSPLEINNLLESIRDLIYQRLKFIRN